MKSLTQLGFWSGMLLNLLLMLINQKISIQIFKYWKLAQKYQKVTVMASINFTLLPR